MKKKLVFLLILCLLLVTDVYAGRGCCSSHGGVVGCSPSGRQVCADGTYSPSCTCTPSTPSVPADVYGCTDKKAKNYNNKATKDDGSCEYDVLGCTDEKAKNYNNKATKDDGSCKYDVLGCTDEKAKNYNNKATKDDGSCEYDVLGCTDEKAKNYDSEATKDDGSCEYDVLGCTNENAVNYDKLTTKDDASCLYQKIVEEEKKIPYVVQYQEDSTLKENEKIVIQKGIDGTKKVYYLITYDENNREIGREVDYEDVLVPSVAQVVKVNHVYDYDSLDNNTHYNALLSYIYLGLFVFVVINIKKQAYDDTILGGIFKRKSKIKLLWYIAYFLFVIPVIIDLIKIIIKKVKTNGTKSTEENENKDFFKKHDKKEKGCLKNEK